MSILRLVCKNLSLPCVSMVQARQRSCCVPVWNRRSAPSASRAWTPVLDVARQAPSSLICLKSRSIRPTRNPRLYSGKRASGFSIGGCAMEYEIACGCGKGIPVTEAMAGCSQNCECGQTVVVPPLSTLRATEVAVATDQPAADPPRKTGRRPSSSRSARSSPRRRSRCGKTAGQMGPGEPSPWWP